MPTSRQWRPARGLHKADLFHLLKHEQGFKGFNTFLMNHTHILLIFFKRNLMLTKTIQYFLQGEGIELFFIAKCEWGLFFFLSLITHFHRELYAKWLWATKAKNEYLFWVSIDVRFKILLVLEIAYHLYYGVSVL